VSEGPPVDRRRGERPPASIVVATHARPEFLVACVASITAAMRDGDELIVRACCNPDAESLLDSFGSGVRAFVTAHEAKCTKLNAAIVDAAHDVIVLTDDDCRVADGWVDGMAQPFANGAVGVAFGPVVGLSTVPGDAPETVIDPGPAPPELWNYAHGASMAVRRSAVIAAGGFDERLGAGAEARGGEEADLVLRFAAHGWTCEIAPAPVVEHLEWRDEQATMQNLLGYQRGSGVYLGAGLRRAPTATMKTFLLRVAHERGLWRDRAARGASFGPRMSRAFAAGLAQGAQLAPARFIAAASEPAVTSEATGRADARPRVLWVTDEAPDRRGGGGNIRQAMLLEHLQDQVAVTVLVAGRVRDPSVRAAVEAVLEVAPARRRIPRRTARRVCDLRQAAGRMPSGVRGARQVRRSLGPVVARVANGFDVVVVHHLHLAPLIPPHASRGTRPWVLHLFDITSERARHELDATTSPRRRWLLEREVAQATRYEAQAVATYDGVIVVSDDDAAALPSSSTVSVVPNGVDAAAWPVSDLPGTRTVLFPGTLNYRPNVLGAQWFCDEVLPHLQTLAPGVRVALVGREPAPEVLALADRSGVEIHADVPSMAPWFDWARVVAVPLHMGTGTRLKALEAMAASRPVVGTTVGLQGLGLTDGVQARVVDDPVAMAQAIAALLTDDNVACAIAASGRRHVAQRFGWNRIAATMSDVLRAAAGRQFVRKRASVFDRDRRTASVARR
jgi:glycosyltransferase involved in cell wall biosynthesis